MQPAVPPVRPPVRVWQMAGISSKWTAGGGERPATVGRLPLPSVALHAISTAGATTNGRRQVRDPRRRRHPGRMIHAFAGGWATTAWGTGGGWPSHRRCIRTDRPRATFHHTTAHCRRGLLCFECVFRVTTAFPHPLHPLPLSSLIPTMMSAKWMAVGLVAVAAATQVAARPGKPGSPIAGYKFVEDVTEHARLDLDIRAIENAKTNYNLGRTIYTKGKHSEAEAHSDDEDDDHPETEEGGLRTLQGFSTKYLKPGPRRIEPQAAMAKVFWGDWDYANKHLLAAFGGFNSRKYGLYGSGALAKTSAARLQIIKKIIKFTLVPQIVGHEMALSMMSNRKREFGEASEHWDEAWAFYAGSLEKGSGTGFSAYILAEKRAKNFGTMSRGRSSVNRRLLAAMTKGQSQTAKAGQVANLLKTVKCIRGLLAVPTVQGCLRYAYRVSNPKVAPASQLAKEAAEGWAFCSATLPLLASVDRGAAARVRAQTFLAGNKRINWPVVRAAFSAKNLNKMGIKCSDVGSLNVEFKAANHPVCKDGKLTNSNQGTNFC